MAERLYIIATEDKAFVKIGRAKQPDMRLANLQGCCPLKLVMVLSFDAPDGMEKRLHDAFSHKRVRGEWFEGSVLHEMAPDTAPVHASHCIKPRPHYELWIGPAVTGSVRDFLGGD